MDDGSAWTILIDHTVFGLLELKHSFVFVEKNQVVSLKNDATLLFFYILTSLKYWIIVQQLDLVYWQILTFVELSEAFIYGLRGL